jgi:excinuclease ABC subunit A
VDAELVIPDPSMTLRDGALAPWRSAHTQYFHRMLVALAEQEDIDLDKPWSKIPAKHQKLVLHGKAGAMQVKYRNRFGKTRQFSTSYEGVIPWIKRRHVDAESDWTREQFETYMREVPCPVCEGARLKPSSLAVTVNDKHISAVCDMSIGESASFLAGLTLSDRDAMIAERITKEINARLGFLLDVGLDYLTLSRSAGTLAGGEAQRIRLASQIGSGLVGTLYVLDEPSIGLHQRDNRRLIETLLRLRDLGNTVIVVEHDEETIKESDWIVDIGPGAGEHGGEVVYSGPVAGIAKAKESITGRYLTGKASIAVPEKRRSPSGEVITIRGAREHNLQELDVEIPLGCFIAVTGVSGSGKSTLIRDILLPAMMQRIYKSKEAPGKHRTVEGIDAIDKVIDMDQSPIGRTPRSNPATYTGVFDSIRKLFAAAPESKVRGYQPGRFSFNVTGGRCEACSGDGTIKIEMHFLPDVYVPCEVCKGARYNRDTLEITFKGKNIAEVLNMPVSEALDFFSNQPSIARYMQTLVDVGLGYVRLGQSAPTLSGGEAQRVKLASELAKRSTGHTMYLLDEPTTGLHFEDVRRLLTVLSRLVDQGNTVLVIEHNLEVIKTGDWLIDLGPEGGNGGGTIVGTGTPEDIAAIAESHTGRYLAPLLGLPVPVQTAGKKTAAKKAPVKSAAKKSVATKKAAPAKTPAKSKK